MGTGKSWPRSEGGRRSKQRERKRLVCGPNRNFEELGNEVGGKGKKGTERARLGKDPIGQELLKAFPVCHTTEFKFFFFFCGQIFQDSQHKQILGYF